MNKTRYNERSWAIDVINEINMYLSSRNTAIARAGGEFSLHFGQGGPTLFPDVLLFGDSGGTLVRQSWELKMPDTSINNSELLENAEKKAKRLRVNSFLVWNANEAVLYLQDTNEQFREYKRWPSLGLYNRQDVYERPESWKFRVHEIIDDINELIETGKIRLPTPADAINEGLLADFIEMYASKASENIKSTANSDASFESEIKIWWQLNSYEYSDREPYLPLAKIAVMNWLNKFIFGHYLKRFYRQARKIDSLNHDSSLPDAEVVFNNIANECDFMQIFLSPVGAKEIGNTVWQGLMEFNKYLVALRLQGFNHEILHEIVDRALQGARRKVAGQYSTPMPLARLLALVAIDNRNCTFFDPCCGTGTIARAVYELKREKQISVANAISQTWAADKFQFPLQLSTLALSDPAAMGYPVQLFRADIFDMNPGYPVTLSDPNTGKRFCIKLPRFSSVLSNLPFVRFEDLSETNPNAAEYAKASAFERLSSRSDVFGYIAIKIRDLMDVSGKIGLIVSNSWLGTEWGQAFREMLLRYFKIEKVIISGAGRWFEISDVVTTILVMSKRTGKQENNEVIRFATTFQPIQEWNNETISKINLEIRQPQQNHSSSTLAVDYHINEIRCVEKACGCWAPLFSDVHWLTEIIDRLVKASKFFEIHRGERRGWNEMFYPAPGHKIEQEYIRPVLKSQSQVLGLIAYPKGEAFCCSEDEKTLKANGKWGALSWIDRFKTQKNGKGKPLPQVLSRANHYWYEMKPSTQADFVLSMNPDKRLFIAKMHTRGFVDQRLIRFTNKNNKTDKEIGLYHALLNSTLSLFFIEAAGFGRGLGALDLNASKIKKHFLMLNPNQIPRTNYNDILCAFDKIKKRDVLSLEEELRQKDRQTLDFHVLSSVGLENYAETIRQSLSTLFNIRQAVKIT